MLANQEGDIRKSGSGLVSRKGLYLLLSQGNKAAVHKSSKSPGREKRVSHLSYEDIVFFAVNHFLENKMGWVEADFLNWFLGAQCSDKVQYCHCNKIREKKSS